MESRFITHRMYVAQFTRQLFHALSLILSISFRAPLTLILASAALIVSACATIAPPPSTAIRYIDGATPADPAILYAERVSRHGLDYREGYFEDGTHTLHFVETGQGPLVVLIHGFPSYWLSWREQIEALAPDFRVVAVDALGAGLSSQPVALDPYKADALAAQLDSFLQALSPDEPFILIGHDWGSVLSLAYAQSRPDRLRGVIGMSAPPLNLLLAELRTNKKQQVNSDYMQRFKRVTRADMRASGMAESVATSSYAKLKADGELSAREIDLFHASVGRIEAVDAGMNWYRANIPDWDAIDSAAQWPGADTRLAVPTLYIHGERDEIFRPEVLDRMLEVEPMMQIVRLPDVGHWTLMEKPDLASAAIRDFIDELDPKK